MQELVELTRFNALHGFPLRNQSLPDHVNRNFHRRRRRALATAGLQHPQLALLHGKFDILHIAVVLFQRLINALKGLIRAGQLACHFRHRLGRPHACDHILALCIGEKLAVKCVFTRRGIAGKCNPGGAVVAHVAIDHRLHIDRRAPVCGNIVQPAIGNRAIRLPRSEHRANPAPELLHRVRGKIPPRAVSDDGFEHVNQRLEIIHCHVEVVFNAALFLDFINGDFKGILLLAFCGHAHHHIAIRLNKPAIGVPPKARVVGAGDETFGDRVIEAQVEHGLHHAGHGNARA